MYYYRARYYDPSVGRFLQQDPDPGKLKIPLTFLSKYIYAGNNPIMHKDPTGRFFGIDDFFAWAVMSAVIGVIDNNINGGNFLNSLVKGMVVAAILVATAQITPDSFMFDLANGVQAQVANYALNLGSIAVASGAQSGNTFNNFTRNVMNGDSFFGVATQWVAYGFQADDISGVGTVGSYLISGAANLIAYLPTIENYCHPRESNGEFIVGSDGKRVNRCE